MKNERTLVPLYLDGCGDVQMQLISEGTHRLEGPHVLHVADAPDGGAECEYHSKKHFENTVNIFPNQRREAEGIINLSDFAPERSRNG